LVSASTTNYVANNAGSAVVFAFTFGRITFSSAVTDNMATEAERSSSDLTNNADATNQENKTLKTPVANADIILGTFYQSNGDGADATTWCDNGGGSGNYTKHQIALNNDGTTLTTMKANDGIGPRAKCSFQVVAPSTAEGKMAPVVSLKQTPSTDFLFQIIEWYDPADLGAGVIASTNVNAGDAMIASAAADFASTAGVFLNPIKTSSETKITSTIAASGAIGWGIYNENSATANIAGSVGNAIYYDRTLGSSKNLVRAVDSSYIKDQIAVYNTAGGNYQSAVNTFNDHVKNAKVSEKLDAKSVTLSGYSGMQMNIDNTNADTAFSTTLKDATGADQMRAFLATSLTNSVYGYTKANIAGSFNNRYSYLTVAGDASAAANTLVDGEVAHTFGRLGQGPAVNLANGTPFIWQTVGSAKVPGMNINVFPEAVKTGNNMVWTKWTTTASTVLTIEAKLKTQATVADEFKVNSYSGEIKEVAVDGAQALAASLVAAATVAATMF
jgi:hypothetical protein